MKKRTIKLTSNQGRFVITGMQANLKRHIKGFCKTSEQNDILLDCIAKLELLKKVIKDN